MTDAEKKELFADCAAIFERVIKWMPRRREVWDALDCEIENKRTGAEVLERCAGILRGNMPSADEHRTMMAIARYVQGCATMAAWLHFLDKLFSRAQTAASAEVERMHGRRP